MCQTLESKVKTARKDQIVYKVVERTVRSKKTYHSIYMHPADYHIHKRTSASRTCIDNYECHDDYMLDFQPGLHCFRSLKSAKKEYNSLIFYFHCMRTSKGINKTIPAIIKCILPKGAVYRDGKYYDCCSVRTSMLIPVEEVLSSFAESWN